MVRSAEVVFGESVELAVVVPAYQEGERLRATLQTIPRFVDHVVVVDDGSTDDTFDHAVAVERHDGRIDVIRLAHNRGVGGAIVRGYRRALELGAEVAAVMAGDGQMDPADLERVVAPVARGEADYAKGNRLAHEEWRSMPAIRRFGTRLLARLTGLVAGIDGLEDSQCGYTAISRSLLESLALEEVFPRYGYPNDLLLRVGAADGTVEQPVVRPVYGDESSGLSIPGIVVPVLLIMARGVLRRVGVRE